MGQTVLIGLFFPAPVDDRGLRNRRTHGPVNKVVFIVVGYFLLIERSQVSIGSNMFDQFEEKALVYPIADNIFMRPGAGIGLCKYPFFIRDKLN